MMQYNIVPQDLAKKLFAESGLPCIGKAGIREKLSHIHEVERFCDASLETGGTGITRVYFR